MCSLSSDPVLEVSRPTLSPCWERRKEVPSSPSACTETEHRVTPRDVADLTNWNIEVASSSAGEGVVIASEPVVVSSLPGAGSSPPFESVRVALSPENAAVDSALLLLSTDAKPEAFMMEPSLRERMRVDSTFGLSVRPRRIESIEDWEELACGHIVLDSTSRETTSIDRVELIWHSPCRLLP